MSFQATDWARSLPLHSLSAKFTLLMIASYAGPDGAGYPSLSTLASDTLQSIATVRRRIRELEQLGLLIRMARWMSPDGAVVVTQVAGSARPVDHRQTSDELRLLLSVTPAECDERVKVQFPKKNGDSEEESDADIDEGGVSDCNPPPVTAVQPSPYHPGDTPGVSPGSHPLNRNSKTQVTEPPNPPKGGDGLDTSGFEKFEAAYPEPILRQSLARQTWSALTASERELAVSAARGYTHHRKQQRKPANVINAHTFLKGRDAWSGFAKFVSAGQSSASRVFVEEGSPAWKRWAVFLRLCGKSMMQATRYPDGRMGWSFAGAEPPLVVLDPDNIEWVPIEAGTPQWFAWQERLREHPLGSASAVQITFDGRVTKGREFPSEWPPAKRTADQRVG